MPGKTKSKFNKCDGCKQYKPDVFYSKTFGCDICDECFTDANDEREQNNIDACCSNGEQDF